MSSADEVLLADLDGLGVTAIEETAHGLRVFFSNSHDRDRTLASLRDRPDVKCTAIEVPDEDWAARSQAALQPVTVAAITVAPPWTVTPELRRQSPHLVIIQPSMGFGTGH